MLLATSKCFSSGLFQLEKGNTLESLDIAYETWGSLNAEGNNAVLICHGYTNHQHAAGEPDGWFSGVIGPSKAINTQCFFVISTNMLGSAYGSTGPSSIDPITGEHYALEFPDITIADMVNAQVRLLDFLGVKQLAAVIGNSFGGHLALQWGIAYPQRMRCLVVVVSSIKGRGDSHELYRLKHRFERSCPGWNGGRYYGNEKKSGVFDEMVKLRLETLRNYGYENQIAVEHKGNQVAINKKLLEKSSQWAERFDANSLIVLRKAGIQFDVRQELSLIRVPLLYILSRTDKLFPPAISVEAMRMFFEAKVDTTYFEIDSENGHQAPSVDPALWKKVIEEFLANKAM